jgi:preprotein translocase subunit SecG
VQEVVQANPTQEASTAANDQSGVFSSAAAKTELTKTVVKLAGVLLLVCLAVVAYLSRAWYINNEQVSASDIVTSVAGVDSLYISATKPGDTPGYLSSATGAMAGSLYPISTNDCQNWYYAIKWDGDQAVGYEKAADITVTQNKTTVEVTAETADETNTEQTQTEQETNSYTGTYTSPFGVTQTAYNRTDYWLYTAGDDIVVSLDEEKPVTVEYASKNKERTKNLPGALRVAIVTWEDDAPVVHYVYAIDESGTGNSQGTVADTLYAIAVPEGTASPTPTPAPTAAAHTNLPESICTATKEGVMVSVYVWLEGTDAQAVLDTSDDETDGVSIGIHFVGTLPESTPTPAPTTEAQEVG